MAIALETIVERMYTASTERLKEQPKDAAMPPLALIFKGDDLGIIPCQQLAFAGPAWRMILSAIIRNLYKLDNIDSYGVAQESFAITEPTLEIIKDVIAGKPISEMPEREEILVIQAGNNFQTIGRIWNLVRDPETGVIIDFVAKEIPFDMPIMGGFNDLLVEKPELLN
jgi:hypothetical protein